MVMSEHTLVGFGRSRKGYHLRGTTPRTLKVKVKGQLRNRRWVERKRGPYAEVLVGQEK